MLRYLQPRIILNSTRIRALACLLLAGALFFWLTTDGGSYVAALAMEPLWVRQGLKTRTQLERRLIFTRSRQIDPADSMWGNKHHLNTGDRMIQYGIMWNFDCPLDVVYDSRDRIVQIYTSYE